MARGFTLLEFMVAAAMTIVLLTGAVVLATSMMNEARTLADEQTLASGVGLARHFFAEQLGNAGYGWNLSQTETTPTTTTGAPGFASCAASTNLCGGANSTIAPIQIVDSTTSTDELKVLVPRDATIDAVAIKALSGGDPVPNDCGDIATPQAFDVQGVTRLAWSPGDLVLVENANHVSVARVAAAFASDTTTPLVTRTLTLDLGSPPSGALPNDDGGRTITCDAGASLFGAHVFRLRQIDLKVIGTDLSVATVDTAAQASAPAFQPVLGHVVDFQAQLDIARFPKTGDSTPIGACVCNDTGALAATAFASPACTCPAGGKLNWDASVAEVFRIVGLRLGITLAGTLDAHTNAAATPGLFDRSTAAANDRKRHVKNVIYVGLPNAFQLSN